MKKIIYLFAFLLVLGCSSDDKPKEKTFNELVKGFWIADEETDPCFALHNGYWFKDNNLNEKRSGFYNQGGGCNRMVNNQSYVIDNNVIKFYEPNFESHKRIIELNDNKFKIETFYFKFQGTETFIDVNDRYVEKYKRPQ
jgi:hypothetical protein